MLAGWKACPVCGTGAIAALAADPSSRGGSAAKPGFVRCPACGAESPAEQTFCCPSCERGSLCARHRDPLTGTCDECAARMRKTSLNRLKARQPDAERPWENSLGMRFVAVPRTDVWFSVWVTRVRDYEVFIQESGHRSHAPDFEQGPSHPVVCVSWEDARRFCEWLTAREREAGALLPQMLYRLPTDLEWSCAVGLPPEGGDTPKARDERIKEHYPWGSQWPPPMRAGNYDQGLDVDGHRFTSPVGSFQPNRLGLYDLGGNVWEWCQDWYDDEESARVLRGASWRNYGQGILLSSCRRNCPPDFRNDYIGFRCVLEGV